MNISRKEFLRRSALATAGSMLIPNFLKAYELQHLGQAPSTHKALVIIQLSGGNDGLNTVVPFRNDIYYRERPRIAVQAEKVLRLNDEVGLNPALDKLKALYDDGLMAVLNNVGYPNPDRSHFRSMDIWHTASAANEYLPHGWLGRYLDASCAGACAPYQAIEVDDTLSLALKGQKTNGIALLDPKKLYNQTRGGIYEQLSQIGHHDHEQTHYLYKTLSETVSSAAYIYDKAHVTRSKTTYPTSELGQGLKTIAELILSGVSTNVYYISISGFDTHVNQVPQQERLLKQYAEAVSAFVQDLKSQQRLNDVLVMTFSEFGRRVKQNASNGTDHGTANNVFLLGGSMKAQGVLNQGAILNDLDDGDLKHSVDFRSIYASLLRNWLGADDELILGNKFDTLPIV